MLQHVLYLTTDIAMFNYNVITASCIGDENLTQLSEKPQPARNH
jgi:hypothetical protein